MGWKDRAFRAGQGTGVGQRSGGLRILTPGHFKSVRGKKMGNVLMQEKKIKVIISGRVKHSILGDMGTVFDKPCVFSQA